jgi:hypothetical protein
LIKRYIRKNSWSLAASLNTTTQHTQRSRTLHKHEPYYRDSSVDIGTRLRAGRPRNRGSIPHTGKNFFPDCDVQAGSATYLASYSMCTWAVSPGREADHSLASNAEVKNGRAVPPLYPYDFMA